VSFGQGRRGGPGVARTLALSRAEGEYVKVLDADDMLTPGALARDLAVLTRHRDVSWVTSRAVDLLPDGTTRVFGDDPPEGPIEPGTVYAYWKSHDFLSLVLAGTLFVRRDLLLSLGGWMALPASEDTGLMMALDAVSRGWFTREVGMIYRKWPGQATQQAAHTDRSEREARMAVIDARTSALAGLGWRVGPAPD
jgi:glycosyltransferase involved in cell wall biosynthesis